MKGLRRMNMPGFKNAVGDDGAVWIAGHVEDFHVRTESAQFFGESAAAHAGHDHVGQEQIDRCFGFGGDGERGGCVAGFEDGVTLAFQSGAREFAERLLVFDEQDCGGALRGGRGGRLLRVGRFFGDIFG